MQYVPDYYTFYEQGRPQYQTPVRPARRPIPQEEQNAIAGNAGKLGGIAIGKYTGDKIFPTAEVAAQAPTGGIVEAVPVVGADAVGPLTSEAVASAATAEGAPGVLLADGTIVQTAADPTTISNFAGAATPYLGAAGTAAGAYGMYNAYDEGDPLAGALSGLGAGAGLAMLGLGPVGWLAGGGALLGGSLGLIGDRKTTKEYQQDRTDDLLDRGFERDSLMSLRNPGRTGRENIGVDEMTPTDIWGSYGLLDTFGPDYLDPSKTGEFERFALAQAALDNDLIDTNKGDVIVTDSDALMGLRDEAIANTDYQKEYNAWKRIENALNAPQGQSVGSYQMPYQEGQSTDYPTIPAVY